MGPRLTPALHKAFKNFATSAPKRKQSKNKATKMSFDKLVALGVIIEDGRDGFEGAMVHFLPHSQSADSFLVQIKLKSTFKSSSSSKRRRSKSKEVVYTPFVLSLMAVLEMRESNRMQFELGSFTFFVDGTIDLLNGMLIC